MLANVCHCLGLTVHAVEHGLEVLGVGDAFVAVLFGNVAELRIHFTHVEFLALQNPVVLLELFVVQFECFIQIVLVLGVPIVELLLVRRLCALHRAGHAAQCHGNWCTNHRPGQARQGHHHARALAELLRVKVSCFVLRQCHLIRAFVQHLAKVGSCRVSGLLNRRSLCRLTRLDVSLCRCLFCLQIGGLFLPLLIYRHGVGNLRDFVR